MTQSTSTPLDHYLPNTHIESLQKIERGYWWFLGRTYWARKFLESALKDRSIERYADLGCGTGGFAKSISQAFAPKKVALIDGDVNMLARIGSMDTFEIHQLKFDRNTVLPWKPDLITLMDVIEHLEEDVAFLSALTKQISSNSTILLSVPALPWAFSEWDRKLGHKRRYTYKTLTQTLNSAGLKIEKMRYMWSFLVPLAPYRKYQSKKVAMTTEFPPTSPFVNRTLITLSKLEWYLSKWLPIPAGTSLMALARK